MTSYLSQWPSALRAAPVPADTRHGGAAGLSVFPTKPRGGKGSGVPFAVAMAETEFGGVVRITDAVRDITVSGPVPGVPPRGRSA